MHIFRYKEASGAQLALTLFLGDLLWVLDKATIILVVHADMSRWCLAQPIWTCNQRRCAAAPPPFYRGKCWGAPAGLPHCLPGLEVGAARAITSCTCFWCGHSHTPAQEGNIWTQAEFLHILDTLPNLQDHVNHVRYLKTPCCSLGCAKVLEDRSLSNLI